MGSNPTVSLLGSPFFVHLLSPIYPLLHSHFCQMDRARGAWSGLGKPFFFCSPPPAPSSPEVLPGKCMGEIHPRVAEVTQLPKSAWRGMGQLGEATSPGHHSQAPPMSWGRSWRGRGGGVHRVLLPCPFHECAGKCQPGLEGLGCKHLGGQKEALSPSRGKYPGLSPSNLLQKNLQ